MLIEKKLKLYKPVFLSNVFSVSAEGSKRFDGYTLVTLIFQYIFSTVKAFTSMIQI